MTLISALWRHEMWLRKTVLLLLASLSTYLCVAIFWSFTATSDLVLPPIHSVNKQKQQIIPTTSPHFFGVLPTKNQINKPAEKTRLNLTLKGVIPATEMENSLAIITSRNRVDDVYQVGDKIIAGVILQAVYADHIIIRRGDKVESLFFAENALKTLVETTPQEEPTTPLAAKNTINRLNTQSGVGNELFASNQRDLASAMGLQLDGNAYEVLDTSALLNFGLKAGDKIVAINGLAVAALQNGQKFGAIIRQQDVAMLQILRGSRSFSFKYPIN